MAIRVKVYSTPVCPWCVKAKEWLKENKIKFQEFDVAEDEKAREEMIEKSGQMGVPVIMIEKDGQTIIVVGFDQGKLKTALGI